MHGTPGRPPFEPTTSQRRRVEKLAAKGMSQVEIAAVVGIAKKTLAKHFADELARGHGLCRRDLLTFMWAAAKRGRVSAILWLEDRTRDAAEATSAPAGKPLGRKAAALLAAQSTGQGTDWEGLLQPVPKPKAKAN